MDVKTHTYTTKQFTVTLTIEDILMLNIGKKKLGKSLGIRTNYSGDLEFFPISPGARIPETSVFTITCEMWEDLANGVSKSDNNAYTSIVFPAKLYPQVKELLKHLPIPLPNIRD